MKICNGNNLPHELLLTTRQKTRPRNTFENNISDSKKLSKAQISKIIQSGGVLGSLLSKIAVPLKKEAFSLANEKIILVPLGATAAPSAIDTGIQQKIHVSRTTTLIVSSKEMNDILKIVQALQDYNLLINGITLRMKQSNKKKDFQDFNQIIYELLCQGIC